MAWCLLCAQHVEDDGGHDPIRRRRVEVSMSYWRRVVFAMFAKFTVVQIRHRPARLRWQPWVRGGSTVGISNSGRFPFVPLLRRTCQEIVGDVNSPIDPGRFGPLVLRPSAFGGCFGICPRQVEAIHSLIYPEAAKTRQPVKPFAETRHVATLSYTLSD